MSERKKNIIKMTDSYKLTHFPQYTDDTIGVFSYIESRVGATWDFTVVFGVQYEIEEYLAGVVVTPDRIDEAERLTEAHLGTKAMFNRAGWEHIYRAHGGRLPLLIKAVPEGTIVPVGNVIMTIENTCPDCWWLTNYVETKLTHIWYGSTVATLSLAVKRDITAFLEKTADTLDALPFMLHDFGYRGATSEESAGIGGAAHLINFKGTDTIAGMDFAINNYGADLADLAFSVPATEHSVMTAHGQEGELEVLDHLLDVYPTGILSIVSDSYDIYNFVQEIASRKNRIISRNGRIVVRPDSITGFHKTPEELSVALLEQLWAGFGGIQNRKGYRVLDTHVRMLWGDGIGPEGIHAILQMITDAGFSAENMVFGMGGGLLQKVNRDTQRFAFKASAMLFGERICSKKAQPGEEMPGVWHGVSKKPLDASKASKAGRLVLGRNDSGLYTATEDPSIVNQLQVVFHNGYVMQHTTFADIRARAAA